MSVESVIEVLGNRVHRVTHGREHVQHILTKLGFATRSRLAAWSVRISNEYVDE